MSTVNAKPHRDMACPMPDEQNDENVSESVSCDETLKDKICRVIRDSDKKVTGCVCCGGDKMATADALDRIIEWIVTKFRRTSTKHKV